MRKLHFALSSLWYANISYCWNANESKYNHHLDRSEHRAWNHETQMGVIPLPLTGQLGWKPVSVTPFVKWASLEDPMKSRILYSKTEQLVNVNIKPRAKTHMHMNVLRDKWDLFLWSSIWDLLKHCIRGSITTALQNISPQQILQTYDWHLWTIEVGQDCFARKGEDLEVIYLGVRNGVLENFKSG